MVELSGNHFRPVWQDPERRTFTDAREDGHDPFAASHEPKPSDITTDGACVVCCSDAALPPAPANRLFGGALGQAIGAAVTRALEHEQRCAHKLEIQFSVGHGCCRDGLTIIARIADPDWAALDNGKDRSVRRIAWSDLEPRACELPQLVDETVAELEANLDLDLRDQTGSA